MATMTTCSACGGEIDLDSTHTVHVIAKGDRFYHQGCIEVRAGSGRAGVPAYHIPRDW